MTDTQGQLSRVNRDLQSIQELLRLQVSQYMPEWTDLNESNEAAYFLYTMAALMEQMDFLVSRSWANTNLQTVFERPSAIALSQTLDYLVKGYVPAVTTLRFTVTGGATLPFTIPAGTSVQVNSTSQVSGGGGILIFRTLADAVVEHGETYVDTLAREGSLRTEVQLGAANGSSFLELPIPDNNVDIETISIYIGPDWASAVAAGVWEQQDDLLREPYGETEIWFLRPHRDGLYRVCFGDNVVGKAPAAGQFVFAQYYVTQGVLGNVDANTVGRYLPPPDSPAPDITGDLASVTNLIPAAGGYHPESITTIARNAPRLFKAVERAVHEDDYGYLAATLLDVHSAGAVWNCGVYCTVYFVPSVGPLPYGTTPGGSADLAHQALVAGIGKEISNPKVSTEGNIIGWDDPAGILDTKRCLGVVLSVEEARYVVVHLVIDIKINRGASTLELTNTLPQQVEQFMDYHNWEVGQSLYLSDLYVSIESLSGVRYANVTSLTVDPWVEEIYVNSGTYAFASYVQISNTAYVRKVIMVTTTDYVVTVTDPATGTEQTEGNGTLGVQYVPTAPAPFGQVRFTMTGANLLPGDAWVLRSNPANEDVEIDADEFIQLGTITVTVT